MSSCIFGLEDPLEGIGQVGRVQSKDTLKNPGVAMQSGLRRDSGLICPEYALCGRNQSPVVQADSCCGNYGSCPKRDGVKQ